MLYAGMNGAFCPCVLFGKNVEAIKDIPWTQPCACHAIFVEGGILLGIATAIFSSTLDGGTVFLVGEGLVFGWWMCGIYTGLFRQELQKKYHLKVRTTTAYISSHAHTRLLCFDISQNLHSVLP